MDTLYSGKDKTMKRTKATKTMAWLAAGAVAAIVLFSAGCDNNKKPKEEQKAANADFFKEDGNERVSTFKHVEAANGARYDAMLYAHHFDGGHLNNLGRSKVMLMLQDCESCEPITVHLVNCGEGEQLAQRKAAVELYLKTTVGPNALTFHPAEPDIIRLAKTESSGSSDAGTAAASSNGTSGSSDGGSGGSGASSGGSAMK